MARVCRRIQTLAIYVIWSVNDYFCREITSPKLLTPADRLAQDNFLG